MTIARRKLMGALTALFFVALAVGILSTHGCASLGARPSGDRREHLQRSPEWSDGHFENPQPLRNDTLGSIAAMFSPDKNSAPQGPVPHVLLTREHFATPPASGLRVTWLGHSATLLEIDGHRFLTDPVWSDRVGPVNWVGPARWFPTLIALADLLPLDAVVISHDHYDHLDYGTVKRGRRWL